MSQSTSAFSDSIFPQTECFHHHKAAAFQIVLAEISCGYPFLVPLCCILSFKHGADVLGDYICNPLGG